MQSSCKLLLRRWCYNSDCKCVNILWRHRRAAILQCRDSMGPAHAQTTAHSWLQRMTLPCTVLTSLVTELPEGSVAVQARRMLDKNCLESSEPHSRASCCSVRVTLPSKRGSLSLAVTGRNSAVWLVLEYTVRRDGGRLFRIGGVVSFDAWLVSRQHVNEDSVSGRTGQPTHAWRQQFTMVSVQKRSVATHSVWHHLLL